MPVKMTVKNPQIFLIERPSKRDSISPHISVCLRSGHHLFSSPSTHRLLNRDNSLKMEYKSFRYYQTKIFQPKDLAKDLHRIKFIFQWRPLLNSNSIRFPRPFLSNFFQITIYHGVISNICGITQKCEARM